MPRKKRTQTQGQVIPLDRKQRPLTTTDTVYWCSRRFLVGLTTNNHTLGNNHRSQGTTEPQTFQRKHQTFSLHVHADTFPVISCRCYEPQFDTTTRFDQTATKIHCPGPNDAGLGLTLG